MNLQEFVAQLPSGLVYAPIHAKDDARGFLGKHPLKASFDRKFGPADVALAMQRNEGLKAVGIFTAIRGNGIVFLDVDQNLDKCMELWGDSLDGAPKVTSTRPNAAKFIFRVPQNLWSEVDGRGLRGLDYEILWDSKRQGVIFGAYPGGKNSEPGEYKIEGDLNNIPVAPDWLLAEMKQAPKNIIKRDLDFSDRTKDEIFHIVNDCLKVIPNKGKGSRDHWIKIGMAINSALPTEAGMMLWSSWSSDDPDYAEDWEDWNPCESAWHSFKGNGVGLGTLIYLADLEDPKRTRFSDDLAQVVKKAEDKVIQEFKDSRTSYEKCIETLKIIYTLKNPAEVQFRLHQLALDCGFRDALALEKMWVDHQAFMLDTKKMTAAELKETDYKRDYIIPDVLPHPSVVLIYGAGGDGKSMSAWAIAKKIVTGDSFEVRGANVPVKKGKVLILNGDQPLMQIKEQLEEIDYPMDENTIIQTDWQLQNYAQFQMLMQEVQPTLVIIDSLIGCSGGKAFDENKSDFATPLYWLTRNNGVKNKEGKELFPASTILIIHHANKNGGFRGTTAIRDAVDETWALKKPTDEEKRLVGPNSRLITVEKSRSGRSGTQLEMRMEEDLSFSIRDFVPPGAKSGSSPASVVDRVLQRLRSCYPETRTREDLFYDSLIKGSNDAIRKTLQRLEKKGLVVSSVPIDSQAKSYKAVLARGEIKDLSQPIEPSSAGADSSLGQKPETLLTCPTLLEDSVEIDIGAEDLGHI
jgi:hypothetical protein